jgi:hypothetical protein
MRDAVDAPEALCRMFGLDPNKIVRLRIDCKAGEPIIIVATTLTTDFQEVDEVFTAVHPQRFPAPTGPAAIPPGQDDTVNFDGERRRT